jgi:hypothetical protein
MATKVVVSIFTEFQDYNGSTKRSCIYNYNAIVYKVNTNDEIKFKPLKIVLNLGQNGHMQVVYKPLNSEYGIVAELGRVLTKQSL